MHLLKNCLWECLTIWSWLFLKGVPWYVWERLFLVDVLIPTVITGMKIKIMPYFKTQKFYIMKFFSRSILFLFYFAISLHSSAQQAPSLSPKQIDSLVLKTMATFEVPRSEEHTSELQSREKLV